MVLLAKTHPGNPVIREIVRQIISLPQEMALSDALKRMVAYDPAVHVAVVTGEANADLRRQAIALGAKAALAKPAAPPDILSALSFASSQPSTPGAAGSG